MNDVFALVEVAVYCGVVVLLLSASVFLLAAAVRWMKD